MKVEIHTIRYGNLPWLLECARTLDDWVYRHNYTLNVWTDKHRKNEYPCVKFCVVDMWRKFEAGDSDWMVYLDGDIYVHPMAPDLTWLNGFSDIMLMPLSSRRTNGRFWWWCRRYADEPQIVLPEGWWLRNGGWTAIDKRAVRRLLKVVRGPYFEGTMEECQLNYWLVKATKHHGLIVHSPPNEWHRFHWRDGHAWMWHLARQHSKMEALEQVKAKCNATVNHCSCA